MNEHKQTWFITASLFQRFASSLANYGDEDFARKIPRINNTLIINLLFCQKIKEKKKNSIDNSTKREKIFQVGYSKGVTRCSLWNFLFKSTRDGIRRIHLAYNFALHARFRILTRLSGSIMEKGIGIWDTLRGNKFLLPGYSSLEYVSAARGFASFGRRAFGVNAPLHRISLRYRE